MPIPIVDSHIHLFPASHLPTLAWYGPDSPLGSQHCVDEYRLATTSTPVTPGPDSCSAGRAGYLRGFVFVETDRILSVEERLPVEACAGTHREKKDGWKHVLEEVDLLAQIIRGKTVDGDQYRRVDRPECLGIVTWAPVPGGAAVLEKYMQRVKEVAGPEETVLSKIRGVRYLVQDKPAGVMLQTGFIDGLRWLGRQRLTFDLGVDARQGGLHQLREAVDMMKQVYQDADEDSQVVIVISMFFSFPALITCRQTSTNAADHLCKPNLRLPYSTPESITSHSDFQEWRTLVSLMAAFPRTYMKLSGAFSELPSQAVAPEPDIASLVERMRPWTDVVFDAFGAGRVMFGSDWPVCNLGGGGNEAAWRRWRSVVEGVLERRGLDEKQKRDVWGAVATRAYGLS